MNQKYHNNKYEILDKENTSDHPRYPLVQPPDSELRNIHYKDWMNRCKNGESGELYIDAVSAVRNGLIITSGIGWAVLGLLPPPAGPAAAAVAGIINVLLPFLWPEPQETPNPALPQWSWQQLMDAVEIIVDKKIDNLVRATIVTELEGIQDVIVRYKNAACDWQRNPNANNTNRVLTQFRIAQTFIEARLRVFQVNGYQVSLLSTLAQAVNLYLGLLKDGLKFGKQWGMSANPGEEWDDLYDEFTDSINNYTNYCINWYNIGLNKLIENAGYTTAEWNKVNNFRRDMTIMVLDIVSLWPTYDIKLYPTLTKSQLTRQVYTEMYGEGLHSFGETENVVIPPPSLFRWLREVTFFRRELSNTGIRRNWTQYSGYKMALQNTFDDTLQETPVVGMRGDIVDTISIEPNVEVYKMHNIRMAYPGTGNSWQAPQTFDFHFTSGTVQSVGVNYAGMDGAATYDVNEGLACNATIADSCELCSGTICKIGTANPSMPCDNPALYSGRLSWVGLYPLGGREKTLIQTTYGWTHVSADTNNLIDTEKITLIPAVKAYNIRNARVIKGPGSTGGDLVQLSNGTETGIMSMWITTPPGSFAYRVRIRYASSMQTNVQIFMTGVYGEFSAPATTTDLTNLTYNKFGYLETIVYSYSQFEESRDHIRMYATGSGSGSFILDKIEFIPIEGSVETYQADQDLEKARKTVNALFTSDTKDVLKRNVTDYTIDQAANLVECLSDEFCGQEKMILLDQVRFAKRLSQAQNLLNYGDFESPDWSGENGWRTSHHVYVTSDNPIFKGRYLYMPGATSSQFSNNVYPTYVYQKVDESKLKSYTRYLVRGFIGNSKDLELLVERYGNDVYVKMDVSNDIQYSLPMNECDRCDQCKPASYQTRPHHTCTCQDTASMHTDCQCKDEGNRTSVNMYTNVQTGSTGYTNGFHAHKSCGCENKNNDRYPNRTQLLTSCGCKDSHVFSYHIDIGCMDQEANLGLWFALKIASEKGVASIDNLEIIEAQPLTGEALARVKKREQKWKQEMEKKRLETEKAVQAAQGAVQLLFTNAQYNRLEFETLFPQIVRAEWLVQQIPYVYHPFLNGAFPTVPGMNFKIVQELLTVIENAHALYEQQNFVRNGSFSSGTESWHVSEGVEVQSLQNTSVLVLSEWSQEASQQLRIDPNRGYVLRVTAQKEGRGKGTVTMSDCATYTETLTFTSCDDNAVGFQTITGDMLSGFVTKTLEIFPDTDRIQIDICETEGTFKIESVELICMEQTEVILE
ncbi:hypothetical protein CUC43_32300 (plasmid) [Bacillus thuringiensis LM1212]|uniref:insecticidal delta-endotoxin Cry8Ea1 family protein n=1 Tax=Bacillus thuringiensis TaxID=1428 RepID=UPI00040E5DDA|nr:insecticidal delta-endotoxin Cry8Ea1 family protein [Bacillus thuringiensis]AXY11305.1 hypothetical protein CUC43_32300 [Bacillus thuringiensis LM1212]QDF27208.1 hypothetical protein FJR70_30905 [Bacillus tropicus]